MNFVPSSICVAVGVAGLAGAACAQALSASGCTVQVVDKARGAGGRLAMRRLEWLDAGGRLRSARLDHGAPSFSARDAGFRRFLAAASEELALAPWRSRQAAGSRPLAWAMGRIYRLFLRVRPALQPWASRLERAA
jgi:predicted NAD/FAD-dependent oxidoreductase